MICLLPSWPEVRMMLIGQGLPGLSITCGLVGGTLYLIRSLRRRGRVDPIVAVAVFSSSGGLPVAFHVIGCARNGGDDFASLSADALRWLVGIGGVGLLAVGTLSIVKAFRDLRTHEGDPATVADASKTPSQGIADAPTRPGIPEGETDAERREPRA